MDSCSSLTSPLGSARRDARALQQELESAASALERGSATAPAQANESALVWKEIALRAPLHAPRASFFHAALAVPPMQSASLAPAGSVALRLRTAHARSNSERIMFGYKQDFDGLYHEFLNAEVAWSIADDLEVAGAATVAGWDEHIDRFALFDENGDHIVHDENTDPGSGASSRHTNLSRIDLRATWRLLRAESAGWDLALAPGLKIPSGRPHDLTNAGTLDGSLTALATFPLDGWTLHANSGVTVPWGDERIFTAASDVELNPFWHGGLSAVVPFGIDVAGIAQLEANTSAFRDVPQLEDPPATFLVGLRATSGGTSWELGLGTGFDWDAAYQFLFHFEVVIRLG